MIETLRILDVSEGVAAPFCAKLLGDLGADVVKVEKPGVGDATRRVGPFQDDVPHPEKSAGFFFFNTSKRSIELDIESQAGKAQLARLVQRYDIVIAGDSAEQLAARGLSPALLQSWNPALILTTISGFGSFGPYSSYQSSHAIACATGGWAQLCGVPEREPLQAGGATAETLSGAYGAAATLLAAWGRRRHGAGEHVDVSTQQAVLAGAQIPSLLYEYKGIVAQRYSSVGSGAGAGYMLPTETGYIGLNALTLPQWQMLCDFLGRGDIAEDPRYEGISWATPDDRLEEIREIFREALTGRSAEQLFHEAQARRVPFGLVPDLKMLFELPPHVERGFYVDVDHPIYGSVAVPGLPFKSTCGEPRLFRPPLLGEHTEQVLAEVADVPETASVGVQVTGPPNPLPLEGVRVLDLSMFFAGPAAAQICADAGADVIKVESIQRIDGWRGSGTLAHDDVPSWESSPYFNWINRNKRDITLNLTDPRGSEIVKTMVRDADVLIENYTPRVMDKFGLGYETLKEINPRLIMISLSGYGAHVSWRDYVAFGMSTEQMSGVAHLTGYPGDGPLFTGMTGGDLFSGVMGATDILAALHQRAETGQGQHLDFSQTEACNMYVGDAMTGWSLAAVDPGRRGNSNPAYLLQGIYPCGDDGWIAISCKSDDHLARLTGLVQPHADVLNEQDVSNWTAAHDKHHLMELLQGEGVPAGAVLDGPELLADEHLLRRGAFIPQDRPGVGIKHYPNQPYRLCLSDAPPTRRAPLLGEHLEEVLEVEAGLSSEQIVELVIDEVIGTVPLAAHFPR